MEHGVVFVVHLTRGCDRLAMLQKLQLERTRYTSQAQDYVGAYLSAKGCVHISDPSQLVTLAPDGVRVMYMGPACRAVLLKRDLYILPDTHAISVVQWTMHC